MKEKTRRIVVISLSILTLFLSVFLSFYTNGDTQSENKDILINTDARLIDIRDKVYNIFTSGVEIYSNSANEFIKHGSYDGIYNYYYERVSPYLINNEGESGSHKEYAKELLRNIEVSEDALDCFNIAYMYSDKMNELESYALRLACEHYGYDVEEMPDVIKNSIWFLEDDNLNSEEKYKKAVSIMGDEIVEGYNCSYSQYRNLLTQNINDYKNKSFVLENSTSFERALNKLYRLDIYYSFVVCAYIISMFIFGTINSIVDRKFIADGSNKLENTLLDVTILFSSVVLLIINKTNLNDLYNNPLYGEGVKKMSLSMFRHDVNIVLSLRNFRFLLLLLFIMFIILNFIFNKLRLKNENEVVQVDLQQEINSNLFETVDKKDRARKLLMTSKPKVKVDGTIENNESEGTTAKADIIREINDLFETVDEELNSQDSELDKYDVLNDDDDDIRKLLG